MDDDFNTALAISDLFGCFKAARAKIAAGDKSALADLNQIKTTYGLLGLFREEPSAFLAAYGAAEEAVPAEVKAVAEERFAARREKNWAKSDELREKLSAMGYAVKDAKDGYTLTKN